MGGPCPARSAPSWSDCSLPWPATGRWGRCRTGRPGRGPVGRGSCGRRRRGESRRCPVRCTAGSNPAGGGPRTATRFAREAVLATPPAVNPVTPTPQVVAPAASGPVRAFVPEPRPETQAATVVDSTPAPARPASVDRTAPTAPAASSEPLAMAETPIEAPSPVVEPTPVRPLVAQAVTPAAEGAHQVPATEVEPEAEASVTAPESESVSEPVTPAVTPAVALVAEPVLAPLPAAVAAPPDDVQIPTLDIPTGAAQDALQDEPVRSLATEVVEERETEAAAPAHGARKPRRLRPLSPTNLWHRPFPLPSARGATSRRLPP